MSKLDELTKAASGLPDDQLDGLIDFARALASEPFYPSAPVAARDAIDRGLAEHRAGMSAPATEVLGRLWQRVQAALPSK
jgi:predicted transcriptional regulator